MVVIRTLRGFMKCIILASAGSPISSVLATYEMLSLASRIADGNNLLEIELVTSHKAKIESSSGFEFAIKQVYDEVGDADYVIIAPLGRVSGEQLAFKQNVLDWICLQYEQGARVISLCTGAFLLAATGLLNHKTATTHWQYEMLFKTQYPSINLESHQVMCHEGRLSTSGGANAYQDLILHHIGEIFGEQVMKQCAKLLMLDFGRKSLQMYRTSDVTRQHKDRVVHKLQDWLQQHYQLPFKLEVLADKGCLSERQIKRRFVKAVGMPPLIYVQYIRVEKAKWFLEHSNASVDDISHNVGYQDVRFFRTLFKRHVHVSPSQYRHEFSN